MRNKIIKYTLTIIIVLIFILIAFSINYLFLNNLIIGDSCEYDTTKKETNLIFNLFYIISSDTGYHPEPSNLNFLFTSILGGLFGYFISLKTIWKKSTNAQSTRLPIG